MGAMGRYIEAVGVDGRDRIIAARIWFSHNPDELTPDGEDDVCLVTAPMQGYTSLSVGSILMPDVADTYDDATLRWGRNRVVRAIKLRAARLNGSSPEQIAAILAEAPRTPTTVSR